MDGRRYGADVNIPEDGIASVAINSKGQLVSSKAPNEPIALVPVLLAGFANPRYVGGVDPIDAKGFDISDCAAVAFAADPGPTISVVIEQTLDPAGLVGWFAIAAKDAGNGTTVSSTLNATTSGRWAEAIGNRMRFRVTTLTVADLNLRIVKLDYIPDMAPPSVTIGSQVNEDSAATSSSAVGIALEARSSQKTVMSANGDIVRAQATMDGKQIVRLNNIPELDWTNAAVINNVATDVVLKAASGAGVRNFLTALHVSHYALTGGADLVIKDGTNVIFRMVIAGAVTEGQMIQFPTPLKSSANAALNIQSTAAVGLIQVNAQGFTGP